MAKTINNNQIQLPIKAIAMESGQIEKMLLNGPAPAVSRDDVRQWVIDEKRRGSRRRTLGFATAVLGFVAGLGVLWAVLDSEVNQIRQMVDQRPTNVMKNLDEVTRELCGAPPAEYFVRQLTLRRTPGGFSFSKSF